jgi:hypothetical protein
MRIIEATGPRGKTARRPGFADKLVAGLASARRRAGRKAAKAQPRRFDLPEISMDPSVGMENGVQLAVLDIGFQALSIFLNLILLLFRDVLGGFFGSILGLFTGTTP